MSALETKLNISARGAPISIYMESAIVNESSMLSAISERWTNHTAEHWLDIDQYSFHFLTNFCKHLQESHAFPSKTNDKLTEFYYKKLLDNPDFISGAQYLEIDLKWTNHILLNKWSCQNDYVSALNSLMDKSWHYVDCIVYIACMLCEKRIEYKDIHITINRGIEDSNKDTILSCISISFNITMNTTQTFTIYPRWVIVFGDQFHGSYAIQHSYISYKPLENIMQLMLNEIQTHDTPDIIKSYYKEIIDLIPGYNKPELRKI